MCIRDRYLGVGVFVLMVAHVVMSGEGLGGRGRWTQRVLNGVLLAALAFCVVSGIMVSGALLPSLGLYATGYYFWDPVHALSAKVLLAALLVHIVPVSYTHLPRRRYLISRTAIMKRDRESRICI